METAEKNPKTSTQSQLKKENTEEKNELASNSNSHINTLSNNNANQSNRNQRPEGGDYAHIGACRLSGRSKRSIAKELHVTWVTLDKFMSNNRIQ